MTETTAATTARYTRIGDHFALLKPRVMSLVVFTAAIGMSVAPGEVPPFTAALIVLLIALGGGASGALNMWWDADIDAVMRRTKGRPVPAGRITPTEARNFGLSLSALSVLLLGVVANAAAAALLAFTIFFYVVIYTIWLKRTTPWNIVIGGAAGAFPPMIGWVAATGGLSIEPVLMFGLTFMWTPPHFWALALFMKDDYSRARVPMLTVTHGRETTRNQIFVYTLALVPVSVMLGFTSVGGPVYLFIAATLNLYFVSGALALRKRDEDVATKDGYLAEKRFFRFSLIYLFAHFAGLMLEQLLRWAGVMPGGWLVLI